MKEIVINYQATYHRLLEFPIRNVQISSEIDN